VVAAIEVAAGTKPVAEIGKPGPLLLVEAAHAVGAPAADAVMIGDAVTDIAAARAVGPGAC
jgi:ribonucleotide monophosphatase NagD (HAD superfamily)